LENEIKEKLPWKDEPGQEKTKENFESKGNLEGQRIFFANMFYLWRFFQIGVDSFSFVFSQDIRFPFPPTNLFLFSF